MDFKSKIAASLYAVAVTLALVFFDWLWSDGVLLAQLVRAPLLPIVDGVIFAVPVAICGYSALELTATSRFARRSSAAVLCASFIALTATTSLLLFMAGANAILNFAEQKPLGGSLVSHPAFLLPLFVAGLLCFGAEHWYRRTYGSC